MQKKFKYLITSGCSFTEGHMLGARGSWATYLSNYSGLKLINLAKGGNGNELITQNVINFSTVNPDIAKESLYVIQLSECLRFLILYDNFISKKMRCDDMVWHITPHQFIEFTKETKKLNVKGFYGHDLNVDINKYLYENRWVLAPLFSNITFSLWKTHNNIINFINFCETNNYEYLIFDGINNHIPVKEQNGKYYLLNSASQPTYEINVLPDTEDFYKKNQNFGISEKTIEFLKSKNRYIYNDTLTDRINSDPKYSEGNGGHPNELLSDLYAQILLQKLKNLKILETNLF